MRRPDTLDDFFAIPEENRFHELIAGEILPRASPSGEHADAQGGILGAIRPPFHRSSGGSGGPGGWWILPGAEVLLGGSDVVRPDVAGWRRERTPERPTGIPVKQLPDWVCEVLSASNSKNDTIKKLQLYHRVKIRHYWIVDPGEATLTIMRWNPDGYITLRKVQRGEAVRAEPFEQIELAVGMLFGDEPPDL